MDYVNIVSDETLKLKIQVVCGTLFIIFILQVAKQVFTLPNFLPVSPWVDFIWPNSSFWSYSSNNSNSSSGNTKSNNNSHGNSNSNSGSGGSASGSDNSESGGAQNVPVNAQQQQKQAMLKDTAKRVNAWGQKLRSGVKLVKLEGSNNNIQNDILLRLQRRPMSSNKEAYQECLLVGDEELTFPLGKDELKSDSEESNRTVTLRKSKIQFPTLMDRMEFVLTLRVLSQQSTKTPGQQVAG